MARKTKTELLTTPIPAEEMIIVPRAALQALLEIAHWPHIWSRIPPGIQLPETTRRTRARLVELKERMGKAEVAAHPFPLNCEKFLESLAQQEAQGSPALCPPKKVRRAVTA